MRDGDLILVKWRDITTQEGWQTKEALANMELPIIMSPGIFISEDEKYLRIANDLSPDGSCNGTVFPLGCVEEIWELSVGKRIR